MRFFLVLLLIATFATPVQARRAHEPSTGLAKLRYNQAPPDFTFPDGAGYAKLSALLGKPVVINFWTTWCHACVDEMPYFVRLQETYGERVAFISLSNEPVGAARSFLAQHHLAIPLLEDPHGVIFGEYSVQLYPVTVVVDAQGGVSYVSVGGLDWGELQGAVSKALAPK